MTTPKLSELLTAHKVALKKAEWELEDAKQKGDKEDIAAVKMAILKEKAEILTVKQMQEDQKRFLSGDSYMKSLRADLFPELDGEFVLRCDSAGVYSLFRVGVGKEIALQSTNEVATEQTYAWIRTSSYAEKLSPAMAEAAYDHWKKETTKLVEEPALVKFLSQDPDAYTFKRLPFDPTPGPIPAWIEFDSRLTDAQVFRAYIWSIFEPKNKGRQTLWIQGNGENGKSVVLRVIGDALGHNGHVAITGGSIKDSRFSAAAVYGRSLLTYADCKNVNFLMSEFHRNITSGDAVPIERKGKDSFLGMLRAKCIVASNKLPAITSGTADQSRCIVMQVGPSLNNDDPTWSDRLTLELPAYLHECKLAYEKLCANHGKITLSTKLVELRQERSEELEEPFEFFYEKHFKQCDPSTTHCSGDCRVPASVVRNLVKLDLNPDNNTVGDFKEWLENTKRGEFKPGRVKTYRGFKLKDQSHLPEKETF